MSNRKPDEIQHELEHEEIPGFKKAFYFVGALTLAYLIYVFVI